MRCTKLKIWSAVLLLGSGLFNIAQANLITDNGTYTTVNTLDWLDWTETLNQSRQDALTDNPGWRIATFDEADSMLTVFFGTVPNFAITQGQYDSFVSLFGLTYYEYSYATFATSEMIEVYYYNQNNNDVQYGTDSGWYQYVNSGVALVRTATPQTPSVPEPSYMAFLGLGLMYFASRRFKKFAQG